MPPCTVGEHDSGVAMALSEIASPIQRARRFFVLLESVFLAFPTWNILMTIWTVTAPIAAALGKSKREERLSSGREYSEDLHDQ